MLKGKRGNLQEHERAALQDHMLLVLEKNFQLEQQVSLGLTGEGAELLTLGYSVFVSLQALSGSMQTFLPVARHTLGVIEP